MCYSKCKSHTFSQDSTRAHTLNNIISISFHSPTSKLNDKKISSQDDLGNVVGVEVATAPLQGLPATTTTRPTTAGLRDDSSIASGSSGFGSLTKKKDLLVGGEVDPASFISSIVTDSGISESSEPMNTSLTDSMSNQLQLNAVAVQQQSNLMTQSGNTNAEQGHSRNSSNTSQVSRIILSFPFFTFDCLFSTTTVILTLAFFFPPSSVYLQMSKGSGYSSFSHSQHSRQSSEGDSGHTR